MKTFLVFWKRDIINKLIVLTIFGLIAGVGAFIWLLVNMPKDRTLKDAFIDFLPHTATPTFDVNAYLVADTKTPPVVTVAPLTLPSLTPPVPTVSMAVSTPTLTIVASETPGSTDQPAARQSTCVPDNPPETGRALEIIDGNTIKVLIDGKVYVVRYIGIKVPRDGEVKEPFGPAATYANGSLTYGKDIVLISDETDKDERGRLLRYVFVGDTFINLELLKQGFASTIETSSDFSCVEEFKGAEQTAIALHAGMWISTATQPIP